MKDNLAFLSTAFTDFRVAALFRSSPFAVKRIIRLLPQHTRTVVEYGAGDGVITKQLLAALPREGTLFAIETNRRFIERLHALGDHRLSIMHGDVVAFLRDTLSGLPLEIDTVISGIPFTFFSPETRKEIIERTALLVRPGGRFIVYQNSTLIVPLLKKNFSSVKVRFEPRNMLPYFIMVAER